MSIKRVCDVCDTATSDEVRDLPASWVRLKVERRSPADAATASKGTMVDVVVQEACPTCGDLIVNEVGNAIDAVKKAAS